jgi:hypothetical protein
VVSAPLDVNSCGPSSQGRIVHALPPRLEPHIRWYRAPGPGPNKGFGNCDDETSAPSFYFRTVPRQRSPRTRSKQRTGPPTYGTDSVNRHHLASLAKVELALDNQNPRACPRCNHVHIFLICNCIPRADSDVREWRSRGPPVDPRGLARLECHTYEIFIPDDTLIHKR